MVARAGGGGGAGGRALDFCGYNDTRAMQITTSVTVVFMLLLERKDKREFSIYKLKRENTVY